MSRLAAAAGWQVARLSRSESPAAAHDIVICDTIGDLAVLFSVAWVAVLGGSLVKHGGHNPLEAVVWGVPVLTGPHTYNFSAICAALLDAGAMERVEDASSLADSLLRLLTNTEQRRVMGEAGSGVMQANRGALARVLSLVDQALARA